MKHTRSCRTKQRQATSFQLRDAGWVGACVLRCARDTKRGEEE
ncbi:hypothetical protein ADG881_2095 [Alcanivorax sp. DG881]|nr:hypothetical protein ADG881_2095 [Alcanivorax sp. DG881]